MTKEIKPSLIVKRKKPYKHVELHYRDRVDFVQSGVKVGSNKVKKVK